MADGTYKDVEGVKFIWWKQFTRPLEVSFVGMRQSELYALNLKA